MISYKKFYMPLSPRDQEISTNLQEKGLSKYLDLIQIAESGAGAGLLGHNERVRLSIAKAIKLRKINLKDIKEMRRFVVSQYPIYGEDQAIT